jgi:hypothetical protein
LEVGGVDGLAVQVTAKRERGCRPEPTPVKAGVAH